MRFSPFNVTGFEWDEGNTDKSAIKHGVSPLESEEIFANDPLLIAMDLKHSQQEARYIALGKTDLGKRLCAIFTVREANIRIISVRFMSQKERAIYDHT